MVWELHHSFHATYFVHLHALLVRMNSLQQFHYLKRARVKVRDGFF